MGESHDAEEDPDERLGRGPVGRRLWNTGCLSQERVKESLNAVRSTDSRSLVRVEDNKKGPRGCRGRSLRVPKSHRITVPTNPRTHWESPTGDSKESWVRRVGDGSVPPSVSREIHRGRRVPSLVVCVTSGFLTVHFIPKRVFSPVLGLRTCNKMKPRDIDGGISHPQSPQSPVGRPLSRTPFVGDPCR